ncbi:MAG: tyrosine-type recombinase/integrase [Acidiferrobacteraceae bacterium]
MKITKRTVDALTLPAKGYVLHWDDEIKGFGVRVMATGAKSFILQKRIHGKDHRITLGRYGAVTVEQARRDAKIKAGLIASGGDPVADKRRAALATKKLAEVMADYFTSRKSLAPRTVKDITTTLAWGCTDWLTRPIPKITRNMVERRHRELGSKAPAAANKWARYLRALLNFAIGKYTDTEGQPLLTDNPVKVLSSTRAWYRVERRQSVIQPHQIAAWWDAVTRLRNTTHSDYFLTLMLTGLRKEEARGLAWQDVDFAARTLTVRGTKNHSSHTLPMGTYLAAMLSTRERLGPLVFMSTHGQIGNLRYSLEGIARTSGVKFMAHDLRRTFATIAESLDIPAYALKALLNHKGGSDVTGGYLVITTERLRGPMAKIEDYVLKAAGVKTSAEIVVLPKGYGHAV